MKKTLLRAAALFAALLLLALPAMAKTVTPAAPLLTEKTVGGRLVYARILEADPVLETMTVVLCEPEWFKPEDVNALAPGDTLVTFGEEVVIKEIIRDGDWISINPDDFEYLCLEEEDDGRFVSLLFEQTNWTEFAEVTYALSESMIFLDGIDPATGEYLDLPTVHSMRDFLKLFTEEKAAGGIGFDSRNAFIVFGGNTEPLYVIREYVP